MAIHLDPGLQMVVDTVQTVVASEGGSLEVVNLGDDSLTVKYQKGVNEECPECVPDHALVEMLMRSSLSNYAPHIRSFSLI
jgi:hypothetical protein